MNRNQIYEYLKGMEDIRKLKYNMGKGYVFKFVPTVWISYSELYINNFHIENWYSITLLVQGIIVEGEIGNMEFHIKYEDIESFHAYIEERYEVGKG